MQAEKAVLIAGKRYDVGKGTVLELNSSQVSLSGKLSVAKVTFGAEPKDYEVQEYIQKCYCSLKFSQMCIRDRALCVF